MVDLRRTNDFSRWKKRNRTPEVEIIRHWIRRRKGREFGVFFPILREHGVQTDGQLVCWLMHVACSHMRRRSMEEGRRGCASQFRSRCVSRKWGDMMMISSCFVQIEFPLCEQTREGETSGKLPTRQYSRMWERCVTLGVGSSDDNNYETSPFKVQG